MEVKVVKGSDSDQIEFIGSDGAGYRIMFPKKGPFPHDLAHFVVERELGFRAAFWGRVADGVSPSEVGRLVKDAGHASSSRASKPDDDIWELLVAERLVECFEAELWSDSMDNQTFREVFDAACAQSQVTPPCLSDASIEKIRLDLKGMLAKWLDTPIGESISVRWP